MINNNIDINTILDELELQKLFELHQEEHIQALITQYNLSQYNNIKDIIIDIRDRLVLEYITYLVNDLSDDRLQSFDNQDELNEFISQNNLNLVPGSNNIVIQIIQTKRDYQKLDDEDLLLLEEQQVNQEIQRGQYIQNAQRYVKQILRKITVDKIKIKRQKQLEGQQIVVVPVQAMRASYIGSKLVAKNILREQSIQQITKITSQSLGKSLTSRSNWIACLMITAVEIAWISGDYFKGKIDGKTFLLKSGIKIASNVVGTGASAVGGFLGASLGSAICPGLGTIIGYVVGSVAGFCVAAYFTEKYLNKFNTDLEFQENVQRLTPKKLYLDKLRVLELPEQQKFSDSTLETHKRSKCLLCHPDKTQDENLKTEYREKFQQIIIAYELIKKYREENPDEKLQP